MMSNKLFASFLNVRLKSVTHTILEFNKKRFRLLLWARLESQWTMVSLYFLYVYKNVILRWAVIVLFIVQVRLRSECPSPNYTGKEIASNWRCLTRAVTFFTFLCSRHRSITNSLFYGKLHFFNTFRWIVYVLY